MSSIKLKDLGAICRICLKLYKDGEFLFERKQSTSGLSLAEMLNYITFHKLEPSDTLPHFVCENCKRSVCSAYNLKQQYENSYKMLCDLVNDGKSLMLNSSTKELVEKSTQTERNGNKIIGCHCCSRTCKDFGFWKNHIEKVDSFTNIATNRKCHLCGREFSRFEHLRQHLAIIHKILIDSGKQAARKQNLKKDYSTKKAKGQQKLIKDEIQEQLSDGENECPLAELIDTSSSSKNDVTKDIRRDCLTTDDSSILSIKKDELKDSLVTQQPSNVIPGIFTTRKRGRGRPPKTIAINKCNFCNADLKNFATLMSHIQEKHVEIKKFSNTECSSKIDINSKHMVANLHKGVDQVSYSSKLHSCTKCLKSFTTKLYLKRHLEKHDKQRFICKECHENFPSRDELSIHVKAEGHDKPLLCPECGLRCKTSNILMIHIRRHKGEKPFKCKFCTKGFPRSDDLKVHERKDLDD
uniref:Uncharacterized protein n=1 Tax=Glossina brevipalpis TaxID=37001 RepID=A0A1A9WX40_9MUSC